MRAVPALLALVLARFARATITRLPTSRFLAQKPLQALPPSASGNPLLSCSSLLANPLNRSMPWAAKRREAAEILCADKQNWPSMEVFLDNRFAEQYARFYKSDGWAEVAWVNYVKAEKEGDTWSQMTERLVESVHRYSAHPIIVVNFGQLVIPELKPERFPRLVLLHSRGIPTEALLSFNFNKLLAILLASVKVGASLDSDMVMYTQQADGLLNRTAEEIPQAYPFPMMPTHYLDRDPRNRADHGGNFAEFTCYNCGNIEPTMRWGQAQPSWTFWALPFVGRWLAAKLAGRVEQGVGTRFISEDEDLLNVALWREGATKAWCMFQPNGVGFLWNNLYPQHAPGPYPFYEDGRYYPDGVPIAFYFSHAEKKLEKIDKALLFLQERRGAPGVAPKAFFHKMKFYATFNELKAEHPDVRCTM